MIVKSHSLNQLQAKDGDQEKQNVSFQRQVKKEVQRIYSVDKAAPPFKYKSYTLKHSKSTPIVTDTIEELIQDVSIMMKERNEVKIYKQIDNTSVKMESNVPSLPLITFPIQYQMANVMGKQEMDQKQNMDQSNWTLVGSVLPMIKPKTNKYIPFTSMSNTDTNITNCYEQTLPTIDILPPIPKFSPGSINHQDEVSQNNDKMIKLPIKFRSKPKKSNLNDTFKIDYEAIESGLRPLSIRRHPLFLSAKK